MTENDTSSLDALLAEFPADVRLLIKGVWGRVPEAQKAQLLDVVPLLPPQAQFGRLLDMARTQWEMAFGRKQTVAVVGPANVGKSTLYNQFVQAKGDVAAVSAVPGTTRTNQTADAGLFLIADTPGADAVGDVGEQEHQTALTAARTADFLVIVFDALQGIKRTEQELFHELQALNKPYVVVLNKMDTVGGWRQRTERERVVATAAQNLGLQPTQLLPIAAQTGENMERLLHAIVKAEPALLAALGQTLPHYRLRLAWQAIARAASTAAVVALTPIPIIDFIPLAAVQGLLVLSIARIYQYKLTLGRLRELLGVLGMGYVGRTLFYELSKLGGPPGWVVGSAVAATTTIVVGYTAVLWFAKGERLTAETSRKLVRLIGKRMVERFSRFGRRAPSRQELADEMAAVLNDKTIGELDPKS